MPERISYITTKTGAPLSADLQRDASNVEAFAIEVALGMLTYDQISARLQMLAAHFNKRAAMAEAVEQYASSMKESVR